MGNKRKLRGRGGNCNSLHHQHHHHHQHRFFPQLLAAYSRISTLQAQNMIEKLQKMHLKFIKTPPKHPPALHHILPNGLLALLPSLLHTSYPDVAARTAEIVGSSALWSFEANLKLASDRGIINGLVAMLTSNMNRVVMAACNAIMDLSTTSIGRERLLESSVLDKLLSLFCQATNFPIKSVSLTHWVHGSTIDAFSMLVLDAMVILVNMCNLEVLAKIPDGLARTVLHYLREFWTKFLVLEITDHQEKSSVYNYKKIYDLAETMFRLSMIHGHREFHTVDAVRRTIFSGEVSSFELFILNHWEVSPLMLRRTSKIPDDDDIVSCLVRSFNSKTIDDILDSILQGLVACPPVASDELDILGFLKEIKGELGHPIKYEQDIRVLKAVKELGKEVHFFNDVSCVNGIKNNGFIGIDHVQDCKEAYYKGYTIALRGMEFRSEKIAAIADSLAFLFGQPSVGANVYLTPPKSQGLTRHCDDHCVFVCQLLGRKKWIVGHRLGGLLPRLYENFSSWFGWEGETEEFFLSEGDILYIPRGCSHEAHTAFTDDHESETDGSSGFSLHLTIGIEVEPPFEWEGFAHVALHCWNQKWKQKAMHQITSSSRIPNCMLVILLHVAIRLVGEKDSTFRKACMVSGFSSLSAIEGKVEQYKHNHFLNQKTTFIYLINKINSESNFMKALATVEAAVREKNEESLQWMRWLRHLPQEEYMNEKTDWNNPLTVFTDLVASLDNGPTGELEILFDWAKRGFCNEVVFEEVVERFEMLLEKYRRVRKLYMNGMLSLHSTWT